MKAINVEWDEKRKILKRKALAQKNKNESQLEVLKNSKYALLKLEKNLTKNQQEKLKEVKKAIPLLGKMQEIKEQFREILETSYDWATGLDKLSDWLWLSRICGDKLGLFKKTS